MGGQYNIRHPGGTEAGVHRATFHGEFAWCDIDIFDQPFEQIWRAAKRVECQENLGFFGDGLVTSRGLITAPFPKNKSAACDTRLVLDSKPRDLIVRAREIHQTGHEEGKPGGSDVCGASLHRQFRAGREIEGAEPDDHLRRGGEWFLEVDNYAQGGWLLRVDGIEGDMTILNGWAKAGWVQIGANGVVDRYRFIAVELK